MKNAITLLLLVASIASAQGFAGEADFDENIKHLVAYGSDKQYFFAPYSALANEKARVRNSSVEASVHPYCKKKVEEMGWSELVVEYESKVTPAYFDSTHSRWESRLDYSFRCFGITY